MSFGERGIVTSSYHIAPLDFGEGGALVLLSACFLALRSNTQGIRNGHISIRLGGLK